MADAASAIARLRDPDVEGILPLSRARRRPDPANGPGGEARLARGDPHGAASAGESASIGIELVNPGHERGYRQFPEELNRTP
jgi:hypothetical protein